MSYRKEFNNVNFINNAMDFAKYKKFATKAHMCHRKTNNLVKIEEFHGFY